MKYIKGLIVTSLCTFKLSSVQMFICKLHAEKKQKKNNKITHSACVFNFPNYLW